MHFTPGIFRKSVLAPVLAWTLSVVLVAGQVFHCCRLNESIAEDVVSTVNALVHRLDSTHGSRPHAHLAFKSEEAPEANRHPGCHGHAHSHETDADHAEGDHGVVLDEDLSCLSESILSSRAIQPPAPEPIAAQPVDFVSHGVDLSPPLQVKLLPPPAITGSPPVYLRTLRILV
jgi:hypothetical protein